MPRAGKGSKCNRSGRYGGAHKSEDIRKWKEYVQKNKKNSGGSPKKEES